MRRNVRASDPGCGSRRSRRKHARGRPGFRPPTGFQPWPPLLARGDRLGLARRRADPCGGVRVGLVERLMLEERLCERVELVSVLPEALDDLVVRGRDELPDL